MKKSHTFRPSLADVLEDRLVLSTAHAAAVHQTTIQPFQGTDLGAIQNQVSLAFNSFAQDYAQAQSNYLASASTNPQAIAGLNTFVANRVGGLVGQLNGIVGSMQGGSLATASMITGALSGTNLGTLQQRLQSITPVGTNGQTAAGFASQAVDAISLANNVVGQSFQTFGNIGNINAYSQYQAQFASKRHAPLTKAQQRQVASLKAASSQVSQAFSSFLNGFQNARNNVLFNAGTGGTANLATNQTQFNSALSSGLVGFATNLSAALGSVRGASTTLQPSIVSSLFGVGNGNGGTARQIGVTTNGALTPGSSNTSATSTGLGSVGTSAIRPRGVGTPAPTTNPLQFVVGTQGAGTSSISPPGVNPVPNPTTNPFQYLVGTQGATSGGTTGLGSGLFSTIANLSTPTDTSGLSAQQFNTTAFNALNNAFSNIQGRLNVFSQNSNFNFTPFNSISTGSSPFFNSGGLFTPPTGSSTATPIFNGGFFDNTFSPRNFSTGVSTATGFGTTGFSSFFGTGNSTGTSSSGGAFTTFNPTILPDGNFFSQNGPNGLGSSNGLVTTNQFGGSFAGGATNPNNGFFGSSFGSF